MLFFCYETRNWGSWTSIYPTLVYEQLCHCCFSEKLFDKGISSTPYFPCLETDIKCLLGNVCQRWIFLLSIRMQLGSHRAKFKTGDHVIWWGANLVGVWGKRNPNSPHLQYLSRKKIASTVTGSRVSIEFPHDYLTFNT